MSELRYTLLSDGVSDQALIPIITWTILQHLPNWEIQSEWADLRNLPRPPRTLADRIIWSLRLFPCDVLFVHRDAEREPRTNRVTEIEAAVSEANKSEPVQTTICVIPVRMQEAWLLFDEAAIRRAAGNRNGSQSLRLPRLRELEKLPDPKSILHDLIREASGLGEHRKKKMRISHYVQQLANYINDFSPLHELDAYNVMVEDIQQLIKEKGWK